jgi:hypothetical protein
MLLKTKKAPSAEAEEAFGILCPAVQVSGSPPQRTHSTTNRT